MTRLSSALRQLVRDLIDKRLWPVAVVLVIALLAIPILLGRGTANEGTSGDVASTEPGLAAVPGASKAPEAGAGKQPATARKQRAGRFDDPFFDPPAKPSSSGKQTVAIAGASTRAVAPSGGATAKPGKAAAPKPSTASKPPPAPAPRITARPATSTYLRTVVRIDAHSGGRSHPIVRLTPLGAPGEPAALFLGVTENDDRYAVFVLGPGVSSHGDGICKGATGCRMIGLKAGDTQVVTKRWPDGAPRLQYSLRVMSIGPVRTAAARAYAARARVHSDGPEALRALRGDAMTAIVLRTARFDAPTGLVVATATGAVQDASE